MSIPPWISADSIIRISQNQFLRHQNRAQIIKRSGGKETIPRTIVLPVCRGPVNKISLPVNNLFVMLVLNRRFIMI